MTRPELIIPVGIPASGKTTLREQYQDYQIISPDEIRMKIFGVEYDHLVEKQVWEIAFTLLEWYTDNRLNIYFDATSISKWARAKLIKAVDRRTYRVIAHYLECPLDLALKRNRERDRQVPWDVMLVMADRLVPPTLEEGFKEIRVTQQRAGY